MQKPNERDLIFLKALRLWSPLFMLGIAVAVYLFWNHEMSYFVAILIALVAVIEVFVLNIIVKKLEGDHHEN